MQKRNEHPRDTYLAFNDEGHLYIVGEVYFSSVSTIIERAFRGSKFDTQEVSASCIKKPTSKYYGMSQQDVMAEWEDSRQKGVRLHAWIEEFYQDCRFSRNEEFLRHYFESVQEVQPHIGEVRIANGCWMNFLRFVHKNSSWRIYRSEWRIFHEKYAVAGTLDALFYTFEGEEMKFILCDWKRCKHIDYDTSMKRTPKPGVEVGEVCRSNYATYCMQLNCYRIILEDCYGIHIDYMYIVQLHPDLQTFKIHPVMREEQNCREIMLHA